MVLLDVDLELLISNYYLNLGREFRRERGDLGCIYIWIIENKGMIERRELRWRPFELMGIFSGILCAFLCMVNP